MVIPGPSGSTPFLQPVAVSGAYQGPELVADLIQAQIKANILQALVNVRAEREDPIVSTEPPREYFQYATAQVYNAPAIFTIVQDMDLRDETQLSNHINSQDTVVVAVVVEDKLREKLVKKAWRYQAAMMQCLHRVQLTTGDGALRIFSRVKKCQFSGIINLKDEKAPQGVFRQEMSLRLVIDHIENLE